MSLPCPLEELRRTAVVSYTQTHPRNCPEIDKSPWIEQILSTIRWPTPRKYRGAAGEGHLGDSFNDPMAPNRLDGQRKSCIGSASAVHRLRYPKIIFNTLSSSFSTTRSNVTRDQVTSSEVSQFCIFLSFHNGNAHDINVLPDKMRVVIAVKNLCDSNQSDVNIHILKRQNFQESRKSKNQDETNHKGRTSSRIVRYQKAE